MCASRTRQRGTGYHPFRVRGMAHGSARNLPRRARPCAHSPVLVPSPDAHTRTQDTTGASAPDDSQFALVHRDAKLALQLPPTPPARSFQPLVSPRVHVEMHRFTASS
jgi:hypothetical protein